jgi:predicted sulfurtransferase
MSNIINIAGYKFIKLDKLEILRDKLKTLSHRCALKGTILLAKEGINIMLAGLPAGIDLFLFELKENPAFTDIEFKKSYSDFIPFKRLLIKIKKEIITFALPKINIEKQAAKKISPQEFKTWLDEDKPITVLDVRNTCEIEVGKFKNAVDLQIKNFRTFPKAIQKLSPEIKQKPLVMYCTGGIRCEKASAYLLQQGFNEVYQLQGGILKYFQECGDAHYEGKCFVFDERGHL